MDTRNDTRTILSSSMWMHSTNRIFTCRHLLPRFFGALVVVCSALVLSGCLSQANLSETYYLAAHDPDLGVTNYFRTNINGSAQFSSAKFTVGFYDRTAVERLFGETSLEYEYRSTRIELFGEDNKRLKDISAQLTKVDTARKNMGEEDLKRLNGAISEMIARYIVRLKVRPPNKSQDLETLLKSAEDCQKAASKILDEPAPMKKRTEVETNLRKAYGYLEGIRIAVDGKVLVRFFDGAGNEIDVANKTQVIFVASDASRFLEALRQLAEDEEATQNIMLTVLAPRIKEAQVLAAQISATEQEQAALSMRLDAISKTLTDDSNPADMQAALTAAAVAVAGSGQSFDTPSEIRTFLRGAATP